jgi:cytochrome oxidase Cu insertion factor (SCO1/SenC/PrrC family)
MHRFRLFGAVLAMLAVMGASAKAQQPRPRQGDLKVGDAAPDFTVKDVLGKQALKLSDLNGKPVVIIFGSCT